VRSRKSSGVSHTISKIQIAGQTVLIPCQGTEQDHALNAQRSSAPCQPLDLLPKMCPVHFPSLPQQSPDPQHFALIHTRSHSVLKRLL
jgi:hypothetical protein